MAFKFVVFAAFVAIAQAGLIPSAGYASSYSTSSLAHGAPQLAYAAAPQLHAAPAVYAHAQPIAKVLVQEAPANYQFGYAVNDPHTGDVKDQQETRQGDVVQGSYSLLESDGTRRVVHYSADPHNGFNAVVERQGTPVVAKVAAVAKIAAPLAYAAPQLSHGYYH